MLSESGVTGTSAFLGTIAYVAPEQIEGRPVDAKADQYSLACLTYECLTGRPFERETDIATLYAHIRDPFPSVAEAVGPEPPAIDAILARAAASNLTTGTHRVGTWPRTWLGLPTLRSPAAVRLVVTATSAGAGLGAGSSSALAPPWRWSRS